MTSAANEMSNWVARSVVGLLVACLGALCSGCAPSAAGSASPSPGVAAGTETLEFSVEGMICNKCVSSVTAAVKALPGVKSVEVSLEAKNATVVADVAQASPEKIKKAIEDAGFTANSISAAGK